MTFLRNVLRVGIVLALSLMSYGSQAKAEVFPELFIREIKITGDELVVLQAAADISDLSEYWIGYKGDEAANPHAIVPTQQLPAYDLAAGQAVLLTSDGGATCDAVMTTKLSPSLADTRGTFVVRHLASDGLTSTFTTVDSVNWAKSSASSATTADLDIRAETDDMSYAVWYHDPSLSQPWRVGNLVGCTLQLAPVADADADTVDWSQSAVKPLAIIESVDDAEADPDEADVAGDNTGLAPPLITELLPNPAGTGTDSTDEYIELYNSNDTPFYLAGFTLQTGLAAKHSYIFPPGVNIPPKQFHTFYASQTKASMSNNGGQVVLLDKAGTVVARSDPYESAPDGRSWALANGAWYWTTKSTPGTTNVIAQPAKLAATGSKKVVKSAKTKKAKTRKAKAKKTKEKSQKSTAKTAASTAYRADTPPKPTAVHPLALALVVSCALGYGAYVYRKDVANAIHKLRRH
ncbi:hypothetical protein CSA80_02780 [Candidatus Saccharibacteria bacterium]|nr:MAG: hypothetical protein CR973_02895 [Candidatus Saccharibacteria bacterium]PID99016.1 MAG: hypothetical protein CSA80_02780 [Candidatus Saccharibacteria bacterium]